MRRETRIRRKRGRNRESLGSGFPPRPSECVIVIVVATHVECMRMFKHMCSCVVVDGRCALEPKRARSARVVPVHMCAP